MLPNGGWRQEDTERAEEVAGRLQSARIINGSPSETDILTECGIEAADAFIATSRNDHSNRVSAVLAKKMGAKTRSDEKKAKRRKAGKGLNKMR